MDAKELQALTAVELNAMDRWLNARRAWKKLRDKESKGPYISSIAFLDDYFHYPLEGEEGKDAD